ncbi:hypothetical protein [Bacillus sp. FSL K6-3431]|uniref:hypothetical protein n=1 Tax=Bacillus sp. FSL K6-3431 TaxID=2921500 RepID=UPI0030F4E5F5
MKSVKGMTWGTPEFTAIAKAAEREGEANETIENITEMADEIYLGSYGLNDEQKRELRYVRNDLNELTGDFVCYGECQ